MIPTNDPPEISMEVATKRLAYFGAGLAILALTAVELFHRFPFFVPMGAFLQ